LRCRPGGAERSRNRDRPVVSVPGGPAVARARATAVTGAERVPRSGGSVRTGPLRVPRRRRGWFRVSCGGVENDRSTPPTLHPLARVGTFGPIELEALRAPEPDRRWGGRGRFFRVGERLIGRGIGTAPRNTDRCVALRTIECRARSSPSVSRTEQPGQMTVRAADRALRGAGKVLGILSLSSARHGRESAPSVRALW
jgi:hypothetical protein